MMEIAKENFWQADLKKECKFIKRNKIMLTLLMSLVFFCSINIALIYAFIRVLQTL